VNQTYISSKNSLITSFISSKNSLITSFISSKNSLITSFISSKNSLITYFYFFKKLLDYLLFRQLTDAKGFVFYDILFIYIQMQMVQGLRGKLKKIA